MKKAIVGFVVFSAAWLMLALNPDGGNTQTQATQGSLSNLAGAQIALMPFLMGQLESPNAPIAKPLSKSITQLVIDRLELPEETDRIMNRIVYAALKLRFEELLVPQDRAADAYGLILTGQTLDTPRKRAVRLGEALDADVVMVGTVWRYRDKGALTDMPDSPASVGFALYLVDVNTGARMWRGAFDGTQKRLTEDVLGSLKQIGMGLHWLTAEELANYGVKSVMQKLPLN